MNDQKQPSRREFLKIGAAALVALPVIGFAPTALAKQNADARKALSYQTSPVDGKSCATCLNFIPAKNGCTVIPNDDEIVPTGHCTAWVAKK